MHRLDLEWRKPEGLPARDDVAAQEAFVAAYERLLIELAPDEMLYVADAVHPEYQSRHAHGWVRKGEHLAVRSDKGCQRVNLAGDISLENGHCQIVEDLRITAETTVELCARLERANPDKRLIHVILDNAGTNRGQPLRAWLARPDCRIRPIYLPADARNLNARCSPERKPPCTRHDPEPRTTSTSSGNRILREVPGITIQS